MNEKAVLEVEFHGTDVFLLGFARQRFQCLKSFFKEIFFYRPEHYFTNSPTPDLLNYIKTG